MKTIYLIGFMGSGKSTIGRRLSERLDIPFYDTDAVIEEKYGKEIKTIFAENGEHTFRDYETEVLREMPGENAIVATGGGIIGRKENLLHMSNGITVFLQASFQEIYARLASDKTRPLWNSRDDDKEQLFRKRAPIYLQHADYVIETGNLPADDAADSILHQISSEK